MSPKHNFILAVLSKINDDIVVRNTKKRYELLYGRQKKKPKAWIPWVAMAASVVLVLGTLLAILPILLTNDKQVPVYQGMTVSNEAPEVADDSLFISPHTMSLSSVGGVSVHPLQDDNGNHYGNDKGNGKEHETGIVGAVENEFPAVLPEDTEYFAKKNEDIYIYIHISNPDKFEILSFTLNGKKYSMYMFEDGSDMETLILKYNVGDVEGVQSYTIDAIKYVDGEKIKDVRMDGERTVKVNIYPEEQPVLEALSHSSTPTSMTFNPVVTDKLGLIADSQGELYITLFENGKLTRKKTFASGDGVTFDDLTPGTTCDYAVVAVYDAIDGQGKKAHVLGEGEISTPAVVALTDVTIDGFTVSFGVEGVDRLTALGLYEGDTLYRALSLDERSADRLPFDKELCLVATYTYGGKTYTTAYSLPVIRESEGLEIVNGVIESFQGCSDSVLYINHPVGEGVVSYVANNHITEVHMGPGVTEIPARAFSAISQLTKVTLSESLTEIPDDAFTGASLKELIIPQGIKKIGSCAFLSNTSVLETLIIPDGVTEIGDNAFAAVRIESLILPASVRVIGWGAFDADADFINTVYFKGTLEEFKAIDIADWAMPFGTLIYNYGTENEATYVPTGWMDVTSPFAGCLHPDLYGDLQLVENHGFISPGGIAFTHEIVAFGYYFDDHANAVFDPSFTTDYKLEGYEDTYKSFEVMATFWTEDGFMPAGIYTLGIVVKLDNGVVVELGKWKVCSDGLNSRGWIDFEGEIPELWETILGITS